MIFRCTNFRMGLSFLYIRYIVSRLFTHDSLDMFKIRACLFLLLTLLSALMLSRCYEEMKDTRLTKLVYCRDNKTECPEKTTCCNQTKDENGDEWRCCPYENAVCCEKVNSCCPKDYTCNIETKTCDRDRGWMRMTKLRHVSKPKIGVNLW